MDKLAFKKIFENNFFYNKFNFICNSLFKIIIILKIINLKSFNEIIFKNF
jgi:hypothetical protein